MARVSPYAGEQGAVMVMVAIALPVLILFASFAIDVGNWFVHARHLQTQADAGALAAAGDFQYPCNDTAIEARAKEYAGAEAGGYNHQVGGTPLGNVKFALNSSTYPEQPSKIDPTVVAEPPCAAKMIDVKLAETDLPPFFSVAGIVPFINAHARVQIFTKEFVSGALPVAVPDSNPHSASVTFVDESTGETLATQKLTRDGSAGELAIWDNESEPLKLNVNRERIGMRVNLGGGSSSECGQPLVECYELESNRGLVFVHGYSNSSESGAQPGPPLLRDVDFTEPETEGACIYSSFTLGGCDAGLHAVVDFGPCAEIEQVGAKLKAIVSGTTYELEERKGSCEGSDSEWETVGGAVIPIAVEAGAVPVELKWGETKGKEGGNECKEGSGNKCKGSFGEVQRSYSADQGSGPIKLATLREPGGNAAYSLEACAECTHELVATIGIEQSLEENAKSVDSPLVRLRVETASQNQSLDCDPALPNLKDEFAQGCAPKYAINKDTECPAQTSVLWNETPEPWKCVAVQTGKAKGQVWQGMSQRILGTEEPKAGECTHPNEWSKFPKLDYANDPRVVPLIITPFGSFTSTGNETVPVTNFATFYVTGWAGQGQGHNSKSICETDDEAEPGTIVGHFIKYVESLNEGEASEEPCDLSALTPCVAVLTE
jgi:Flp pilus assembly protein TadG